MIGERHPVILIIGYGNSLRRDDGAGLILAENLETVLRERELDVERIAAHQLTPDLALAVAAVDVAAVVFVDTRVAMAEDRQMDLQIQPLGAEECSQSLGHHLGPSVVLTYARLLYDKCPPAWLLTAPGVDFDHGEGLSDGAKRALDTLPALLRQLPSDWPLGAGSAS
jgi:hydrogenase maturation protease